MITKQSDFEPFPCPIDTSGDASMRRSGDYAFGFGVEDRLPLPVRSEPKSRSIPVADSWKRRETRFRSVIDEIRPPRFLMHEAMRRVVEDDGAGPRDVVEIARRLQRQRLVRSSGLGLDEIGRFERQMMPPLTPFAPANSDEGNPFLMSRPRAVLDWLGMELSSLCLLWLATVFFLGKLLPRFAGLAMDVKMWALLGVLPAGLAVSFVRRRRGNLLDTAKASAARWLFVSGCVCACAMVAYQVFNVVNG